MSIRLFKVHFDRTHRSPSASGESNGIDSDTEDAIYAQMYFQDSPSFNSTLYLPKHTGQRKNLQCCYGVGAHFTAEST